MESSTRSKIANVCNIRNTIQRFNWSWYILIAGVLFPILMVVFDFLLFSRVISEQVIREYVVLTYASPNVFSMYLSNFAHLNINHMVENLLNYLVTIIFIVIVAKVAVPFMNDNNPGANCKFGTKTLLVSTGIFLTVVPFIISAESIFAGDYSGIAGGLGFSGVVFAFEGYLVYIMELLIIRKVQVILHKRDKILVYSGIILAALAPLLIIASQIGIMHVGVGAPVTNYGAHVTGFLLGIIIPAALDRIWMRPVRNYRRNCDQTTDNNGVK